MVMVAALRPRQPTVRACSSVAYNSQVRADFAQRVLDAQQENERRRAGYRAMVTIGEALP